MQIETQVFKNVDGLDIAADIYPAPGDQTHPAVVFIHGGGLIMGSRKAVLPSHVQAFNEAGFHFVSIDYRLAPEAKLPSIVCDIEDAWSWLLGKALSFGIDRERVAMMGHSAGGYLALMGGYRLRPRPAAIVSMAGYGALTSGAFTTPGSHHLSVHTAVEEPDARQTVSGPIISESGPNDSMQRYTGRGLFYLFCRQQGNWLSEVSGHEPDDRAWFHDYEPLHNVSADYPPTMLLHGEPDTDIPIEHSKLMQKAFIDHDVAHEFVRDPNWGHAFLYMPNDPSVGDAFDEIVMFLKQHV